MNMLYELIKSKLKGLKEYFVQNWGDNSVIVFVHRAAYRRFPPPEIADIEFELPEHPPYTIADLPINGPAKSSPLEKKTEQ